MSSAQYDDHVLATPVSLALVGRHARGKAGLRAWVTVLAELRRVDRVFNPDVADSCISRLARGDIEFTSCPSEVGEVLEIANLAARISAGAVAPYREDPGGSDGSLVLDLSAVVKGWAIERAARSLVDLPDTDYCLSVGGDVTARTQDPASPAWQIWLSDPWDPHRLLARASLRTGAIATATIGAVTAGAIEAAPCPVSVTVVGGPVTWLTIEATAALALGPNASDWLRARSGRTGLLSWSDGTVDLVRGDDAGATGERVDIFRGVTAHS